MWRGCAILLLDEEQDYRIICILQDDAKGGILSDELRKTYSMDHQQFLGCQLLRVRSLKVESAAARALQINKVW